jgi:hypothetical protein
MQSTLINHMSGIAPNREGSHAIHRRIAAWLSMGCLGLVLMLPSGVEAALDGLPWMKPGEAFIAAAVIPLLLLLNRKWLSFRPALLFISLLCALKIFLALASPQAGWCIRVYTGSQDAKAERLARTWESLWCKGCSAILSKPMDSPHELPAEWLNRLDEPERSTATPIIQLSGYAVVPRGWGLAVAVSGIKGGLIRARDANGRLYEVPFFKHNLGHKKPFAGGEASGVLAIKGRLAFGSFKESPWSLAPLLISPEGQAMPARGKGVLWQDKASAAQSVFRVSLFRALARSVDWGVGLWLLGWLASALIGLFRGKVLTASVAGAALTGLAIWWALLHWGNNPLFVPHGAAFAALGVLTILYFRKGASEAPRPGLAVLLVIGPILLIHFGQQWAAEAGRFTLYSLGDDWLTYQRHASDIVLGGDYLMVRRQPVLYEQPLYRYVAAFLHVLFGQSTLAQNLLDVWSAIGGAALIAALAAGIGTASGWAFLAAWLYANFELGDRFLLHIGCGLQEHSAMLFMLLVAWAALRSRSEEGFAWPIAAGFLSVAGLWLRLDHLGVLAGLGLLMVPEVAAGWSDAWRNLLVESWHKRNHLIIYWGLLAVGVLSVIVRNGLIGGQWVLVHPDNASFIDASMWDNFLVLLDIIDGSRQGSLLSAWVMWPGTMLGLSALIIRYGAFKYYPLSLGISLAGLLAPYLLVQASAYYPRWSVHLLPLTCLSVAVACQGVLNWWNAKRTYSA